MNRLFVYTYLATCLTATCLIAVIAWLAAHGGTCTQYGLWCPP